jgi:hypothetical protein
MLSLDLLNQGCSCIRERVHLTCVEIGRHQTTCVPAGVRLRDDLRFAGWFCWLGKNRRVKLDEWPGEEGHEPDFVPDIRGGLHACMIWLNSMLRWQCKTTLYQRRSGDQRRGQEPGSCNTYRKSRLENFQCSKFSCIFSLSSATLRAPRDQRHVTWG